MLDVRTPGEYEQLGHIPQRLAAARLTWWRQHRRCCRRTIAPVLVYCEHGVRSVAASQLLRGRGDRSVLNLAGGLARVDRAA